jgi:uncharacterized membrane protein HdeD (DUF308 family)
MLTGPLAAFALLLVVAAGPKIVRPQSTLRALSSVGLPRSATAVRLLGGAEVVVGVGALVIGGRLFAALVAASYLAFAAFVALALVRGGALASCGCFGKPETPPTRLHLVVNAIAAAVAIAVAVNPGPAPLAQLGSQPLAGLPFLVLVGCCTWFTYLSLSALPALRRPAGATR